MKRLLNIFETGWLLAAFLAFLPLATSAQVVPDWQRSTPGTTGVAMARDATDNVYVLGVTSPTVYDAGVGTAVLSRYTKEGVLQWSTTWFPPGPSYAGARPLSVFTDAAGNAIVIGELDEWNYIVCAQITPTCTGVSGVFDAGRMVLKYSPDGTLLWAQTEVRFRGHWDSGVVDTAGDIYLTGRGGSLSYMNTTQKLSGSTGATLWSNSPTVNGSETPGDIRLRLNGHVVSSAAGANGMSLYAYAADTGALVWSTLYSEAAGNYAPGLAVGPAGELVATGSAGTSLFVAALDANNVPLFTRTYPEGSQGRRIVVDGQGNILVNGVASTPTNWVTLKFDPATGNLIQPPRVVDFHSTANEVPYDMTLGSNGSLFVVGSSGPATATDALATRAATARYLPDGSMAWFASTPDASAAVAVEAATDGAVFVLGNSAQTLMHYPANQPPVAVASASPNAGPAPLTVNFSSISSTDPDGSIVGWAWDFGNGQTSTAANPSHTYAEGSYTARLRVTDNLGATSTWTTPITITATGPQPASLTLARNTVSDGNSTTATVTVSSSAGVTLALASSNTAVATVPATLVVPAGATSARFTVKTSNVRRDTVVTITATANGASATAMLTVRNK